MSRSSAPPTPAPSPTARSTRRLRAPQLLVLASTVLIAFALTGALTNTSGASAGQAPPPAPVEECQAGAVMARAFVDASASFPSTFVQEGVTKRYNCASSANKVLVRRANTGTYEVRFPGISEVGTGPLVASVDVAQLVGGITPSEDMQITAATREGDGQRTLVIACGDVDNTTRSDLCDFTVTLFGK